MDMAAFRGRSLLLRGLVGFVSAAFATAALGVSTGFDFCASNLGTLMLAVSRTSRCGRLCCAGVTSLDRVGGPAIEVSGMLVLRGGGGKSEGKL